MRVRRSEVLEEVLELLRADVFHAEHGQYTHEQMMDALHDAIQDAIENEEG
jgi:hypothetical protein